MFFLYWQDPSNLQGKVQKHQAFEAELSANQSRIDALEKAGQKLIDVNHYAKDEVAARMNEVISLWKKLLEATELKGRRGRVTGLDSSAGGINWSFPVTRLRDVPNPGRRGAGLGVRAHLHMGVAASGSCRSAALVNVVEHAVGGGARVRRGQLGHRP